MPVLASQRTGTAGVWQRVAPYLAALVRIQLGCVFLWASLEKLLHPQAFAWSIANYHLVPDNVINSLAITLPPIELAVGILLCLGIARAPALLACAGMLLVFIAAISVALHRGLDISCGCFSVSPKAHTMTRATLYWDIAWLAMAVFALRYDHGRLSLPALFTWTRRRNPPVIGRES